MIPDNVKAALDALTLAAMSVGAKEGTYAAMSQARTKADVAVIEALAEARASATKQAGR